MITKKITYGGCFTRIAEKLRQGKAVKVQKTNTGELGFITHYDCNKAHPYRFKGEVKNWWLTKEEFTILESNRDIEATSQDQPEQPIQPPMSTEKYLEAPEIISWCISNGWVPASNDCRDTLYESPDGLRRLSVRFLKKWAGKTINQDCPYMVMADWIVAA